MSSEELTLQKSFDDFITFLELILDHDATYNGKKAKNPIRDRLLGYKMSFNKATYEEHTDDVLTLYNSHKSDIESGHTHDSWLLAGKVVIQFGNLPGKSERIQLQLSNIYYKAEKLQKQSEDKLASVEPAKYEQEAERMKQELNYCQYFHLYLYRLITMCVKLQPSSPIKKYITELEVMLGLKKGETPEVNPIMGIMSGISGAIGMLGLKGSDGQALDQGAISTVVGNLMNNEKIKPLLNKLTDGVSGEGNVTDIASRVFSVISDADTQKNIADVVDEIMPGKGKEALAVLNSSEIKQMESMVTSAVSGMAGLPMSQPPPQPVSTVTIEEIEIPPPTLAIEPPPPVKEELLIDFGGEDKEEKND